MTADSDLPVWTIAPNWGDGILERLEWLTDVLGSTYGTEQRRALRLSPRRSFEVNFQPLDEERGFFDLWLHRLGSNEFMVPLWHDRGSLSAGIAVGAVTIPLDTTYREFTVGGLAIIVGPDPFTWDKVQITAITDTALTVAVGGVTRAWPAGSVIHPLRRARLDEESVAAALTSRVGQGTLRIELNQSNDIADEGAWDSIYSGYPVVLTEPNRREQLDLRFQRNRIVVDNDAGLRELADDAGRAFTLQTHQMMLNGREEQWAFRQMLYRLRGQQGSVWLPTFNRDIELSRDRLATDALIDIKKIGYAYTGGSAIGGRQHLLINGSIARKVTGVGASPSGSEERLLLDSALGSDLPSGTYASFMDTCRLGQDKIEIKHHTDSDGLAEAALSFRAFRDERTPPATLDSPIPAAVMSADPCGSPAPEESRCTETGFWAEFIFKFDQGANIPLSAPGLHVTMSRAGNPLPYIDVGGAIGTWSSDIRDGHCWGMSCVMEIGDRWPTDPFIDGVPDDFYLSPIQFGAFQVGSDPPGGLGIMYFRRPGQDPILLTVTSGDGNVGTPYYRCVSLWPMYTHLSF